MQTKRTLRLLFLLTLLVPFIGHAQIVTSKKEAIKKGIYQKPSDKKVEAAAAEKPKPTVAVEPRKDIRKTPKQAPAPKPSILNDKEDTDLDLTDNGVPYTAIQMINNAMTFIGVPYHGGGTTPAGMDCSGMVTAVFSLFDKKLPRSSWEMAKVGAKVDLKDVRKGDLVFFRTSRRNGISHVGMVVEVNGDEVKFIHSSTSEGVIISSTKEPYYQRTFVQANRVL